jgi:tetratricopeptide (TPR) repeat protein
MVDKPGTSSAQENPDILFHRLDDILNMSRLYTRNKHYARAKEQYNLAFDVVDRITAYPDEYEEYNLFNARLAVYLSLSGMYFQQGDYVSSLHADFQAVDLLHQMEAINRRDNPDQVITNIRNLIVTLTRIADCYNLLGDLTNALKYARQALSRCKEETNNWGLSALKNWIYLVDLSLVRICCDMGKPEEALTYCREFVNICDILPDSIITEKGKERYDKMNAIYHLIKETGTYRKVSL